jgi:hypothetical protein
MLSTERADEGAVQPKGRVEEGAVQPKGRVEDGDGLGRLD